MHQTPTLRCFSSRVAVAFAQSIEARCKVENKDVVGQAMLQLHLSDQQLINYRDAIILKVYDSMCRVGKYVYGWYMHCLLNVDYK